MLIWSGRRTVLQFGVGLIGRAIASELTRRRIQRPVLHPFSWLEPTAALDMLRRTAPPGEFEIVWSAGKGGFAAPPEAFEGELKAFEDVVGFAKDHGGCRAFHLVSSAGGLFEGQRYVDAGSVPRPLRPYGEAKLRQEQLLHAATEFPSHIYRPSSVYGMPNPGVRSGLITTIVENVRSNSVTTIFGSADTLRDYVHAEDVGRYVAARVHGQDAPPVSLLASSRPASIGQVLSIIARLMQRPSYVRYANRRLNSLDMTYRQSALPSDWRPIDLEAGIARLIGLQAGRIRA